MENETEANYSGVMLLVKTHSMNLDRHKRISSNMSSRASDLAVFGLRMAMEIPALRESEADTRCFPMPPNESGSLPQAASRL
jgi:hypothetical protein